MANTPSQLHSYCVQQLHMVDAPVHTASHWSIHMPWLSLIGYGLVAFVAFEVGHYGIAAIYTWIKSKLTKTSTVSTTVVTATAPTAA